MAELGELELRRIVEVPVLFRRAERQVRFNKTEGEDKRFARLIFRATQTANGFVGNAAIGIRVVGNIEHFPAGAARQMFDIPHARI